MGFAAGATHPALPSGISAPQPGTLPVTTDAMRSSFQVLHLWQPQLVLPDKKEKTGCVAGATFRLAERAPAEAKRMLRVARD